jgi:hypothetical protein
MENRTFFRLFILLSFLGFASLAQAQTPAATPALPGYWNIETNLTTRAYTTVRFYNGQDQLVYEETLPNVCLDLSRRPRRSRRLTRQLNSSLQVVLGAPTAVPAHLLASQFKPSRQDSRSYASR